MSEPIPPDAAKADRTITLGLLGATGQVGGAVLSLLSQDASCQAPLSDIAALTECIPPCSAVISCIATNDNTPGCSIALDTAHSVVAALARLRCLQEGAKTVLPRIIVLSSAVINSHLCRDMSRAVHWMLRNFIRHIYDDLERAEAYYRIHSSWMTAVFVQPGGLVHDRQVGHAVSVERQQTFLSFLDLAAGMIDCAVKDREATEWDWRGVSVVPTGATRVNLLAPFVILRGGLSLALPWIWSALPLLYWPCRWMGWI